MAVVLGDFRQALQVRENTRGLRQSEAFFQHVQNLPALAELLFAHTSGWTAAGICVSSRPRPLVDSYMPVFLPGLGLAKSLAAALNIPWSETSHQENHIWAALSTAPGLKDDVFLALHVSGGTTDLLLVKRCESDLEIEALGTAGDLHAGQFVDRIGVALGLHFPAGPQLESLAALAGHDLQFPSVHSNGQMSFSGPESAARRAVDRAAPADIAYSVFSCVARTLEGVLLWAEKHTGCRSVLLAGGVMANRQIAGYLSERFAARLSLYSATPKLSVDNAVGAAILALRRYGPVDRCWEGNDTFES